MSPIDVHHRFPRRPGFSDNPADTHASSGFARKGLALGIFLTGGILLLLVVIVGADLIIRQQTRGVITTSLTELSYHDVALVLGCSPTCDGNAENPFFANRIHAAAMVFGSGKAGVLLVSGAKEGDYDEPAAMRSALIHLGVPADHIVQDPKGFSTFDSIVRAQRIYGLSRFIIISQADHARRAAFMALQMKLDVTAFPAPRVGMLFGLRTLARESLARVRAIFDLWILPRSRLCPDAPISLPASLPS